MKEPVSSSPLLLLRTLGEVCLDGATPALASRRKELTLLAFLARRAPRAAKRAELASLLWEDRADTKARQSLRQALLDLKRLLGPGLLLDGDLVRLESGLRVDTRAFEDALAAGSPAAAVEWWHGDFLAEMDDVGGEAFRGWVEAEREGLRRQLGMAYEQLVRECGTQGDRVAQLAHAERWAELRPGDEAAQRAVVEALAAAGRPGEARARHATAAARLRAEFDTEPTPSFARLGERLGRVLHPPGARRMGSAALFTPDLVGRDDALAELRAAWTSVRAGACVTVLVEGDPGIGKSRLCDDFLLEPGLGGASSVLLATHGRRSAGAADQGALPHLLAPLAGAPGLGGTGRPALAALAELVPGIRERFPDLPPSPAASADLGEVIAEAVGAVADERPVILYLDDLGALDTASRSALTAALRVAGSGVLAIVTARSEDADGPSDLARMRALPGVRRLTLAPLSITHVHAMLTSMLAVAPGDQDRLAERLHAEGGGNPSYTVEIVSALVEDGSLTAGPTGTWQLSAPAERQLPLPRSLRDAVGRRIELLDHDRQAVLEVAAVLGRVFRRDLLAVVAEREVWATEAALGDLLTRRLIRRVPGAEDTFEFVNELVPRVTYERIAPKRRRELHLAAAGAWRERRAEPDAALAAAYHQSRARAAGRRRRGPWRAAVGAGLLAGVALLTGMWAMGAERRATLATLLTRPAATLAPNRIVVAPLVNRTGDSTLAPIGDLAADWIARGLTQTAQFQVVDPRTAWITAKLVTQMPLLLRPAEVAVGLAEETGSGLVVSGSYYREGDSLRFEVQITDVLSHKLTRALNPVSALIGDAASVIPTLARRTVATVATAVDTQSAGMAAGLSQPPSYQAYDELGRAWESFWRDDTADVFQRTARVIALDSTYMPPRLMAAYVRSLSGQWPTVDSIVRGIERQRSRLTPAENAILDGLRANLQGDRPARVRAARDLARRTPGSFEGLTLLAEMALSVDDPRQSLDALSHVDPDRGFLLFSPIYWQTMAKALHQLGRYDEELKIARQGSRRFPHDLGPQVALIRAFAALGRADDAERELRRALRGDPDRDFDLGYRALTAAAELRSHGHVADAARVLGALRLTAPMGAPTRATPALDRIDGDLLYEARRWGDARTRYAEVLVRYPLDIESLVGVGTASGRLGDVAGARRVDSTLAAWPHPFALGRTTYGRARIAAVLGDSAAAITLLERSFREGFPAVSIWERHTHTELDFQGWAGYAPFRTLMGLP
ncbi:MAG: AAA family ATPase [Gemmatimonadales bacterium]